METIASSAAALVEMALRTFRARVPPLLCAFILLITSGRGLTPHGVGIYPTCGLSLRASPALVKMWEFIPRPAKLFVVSS